MGYNTTVFILNDQLSSIEKEPDRFVRDIVIGLNDGNDHALGQSTVMRSDHADVPRLYFTQGNSIIELSPYARRTQEIYARGDYAKDVIDGAIHAARSLLDGLEKAKENWS